MNTNIIKKTLIIPAIALCLLAALLPSFSSKAANDRTGRGIGFTTVLYNNTNGLATSDANAVVQTKEGFIWIGSYGGLIRYDGNSFYRYDASTGISSVVSLFADSKNRLWIGTNDSGIFVLEDGVFTSYDRSDGLRSLSIRSIIEDKNGNILFGTTAGVAYIDPQGAFHQIEDSRIDVEYICELNMDNDGVVYALSNSGSFFTIENLKVKKHYDYEDLGYGMINTVYPDPDNPGYLYLGMQDATLVYGNLNEGMANSQIISVKPQQNVACIRKIEGQLWICADNGIGYMIDENYVPLSDLPMNNSVEHMFLDYENNLWFTSSRQGLMKIVRNRFINISEISGLPTLVVNSTYLKNGLLYLGTDNGLKIVDENFELVENDLTALMDSVRIRSIHEDSKGLLWFGTNSDLGLLHYDPETGEYGSYNTENGLASNRARTCLELSDGRMAVATNSGVNIIENGNVTTLYDGHQGLRNLEILCLEEAADGKILAGSDGDGIYVIDGDDVTRIGIEEGLSSDVILRIHRDPYEENLVWIITSNAINYMKNGEIHILQNFPYANNFDLVFSGQEDIWVLASNGLYQVRRSDMIEDSQNISYNLYDIESGLPDAPTANSYSCLTEDGTLYIAAASGVSSVDLLSDEDASGSVRLAIPFVMIDDKEVYVHENEVTIPSDCKRLTIYAYAFNYSLNNPELSYQLEGFDERSTTLSQHALQPIVYTNLAGGNYNFHFSTVNTMTREETQVLELKVFKEKKLVEQVWFWIILAVIAAAVVVLIVSSYFRRKTRLLMKKHAEREKLIDEMTDVFAKCIDLKDPYTNGHSNRVAKYSVMLAERMGKSPEELARIRRIALLHDIGKISIPDRILNKPERLDDEEFAIMKSHSSRGAEILKDISIEPDLAIGAGFHHERIDGRGYPQGLKGDEIPEIAQIIAVADTFDAMYSTRPYRKQVNIKDVAAEIDRIKGTQLNSEIAELLLKMIDEGAFDDIAPGCSE
ncbi:MAG: HD domain-containing protein [Parasporobacterium sp.]|nr:HD domain-containing protein [Parasporobacterium sp.]